MAKKNKPVRFKQIAIADGSRSQLVGLDAQGRIWERHGDMPIGEWGQVEAPREPPNRSQRASKQRSTKR